MTQCNHKTRLDFHPDLPVDIEFSADDISTDGGALLVRQVDDRLGLCERFAALMPDDRDETKVTHTRTEQIRQRVFQIAQGWEDQNDADSLRDDPVFKIVCEADTDESLSSQPTLSRMENAVEAEDVERMQWMLFFDWLESLEDDRRQIVLDVDASGFEGHGRQQKLNFCGFFGGHKLNPLLIFDGDTGQLITIIARGGSAGDSAEIEEWIPSMITAISTLHSPDCSVLLRADAGFATPRLYRILDEGDETWGQVGYLIGFSKNSVVNSELQPALEQAHRKHRQTGRKVRVFDSFDYQAKSWERSRTIVGKAEVSPQGENPRFLVTNLDGFSPRLLYDSGYCGRGRCEQRIGEYKNGLRGDRISCHRFEANALRMILHAIGYRLLFGLRETLGELAENTGDVAEGAQELATATFQTIRLRLLKVAFVVRRTVRRWFLQGARSFPSAEVFHHVARAMN